jgi:deazaflavin-dependent oxidoreductase (nitroreductase family)
LTDTAAPTFEDRVIADMRAHDGNVTSGPLAGHPLLIMTAVGAVSGLPRRSLLTWSRDGADYMVAGTNGGSRTDPAWASNIVANPDVTIEVGNRESAATAAIVDETDRARLWDAHVAALPWFADYPAKSGRDIPMARISLKAR